MKRLLPLLLLLFACTKPNPLDCTDGECSDPSYPFCDKDGLFGETMNTCISVSCPAPDAFIECKGDIAVSCNSAGDSYDLTPCANGCNEASRGCNLCTPNGAFCTLAGVQHCSAEGQPSDLEACAAGCTDSPTPHCRYISPRYLPDVCDVKATADMIISADATLGTDLATSCTGGVVQQPNGGPDLCVVRSRKIVLNTSVDLKVTGNRALVLVADDSLEIHGTLDVSADTDTNGPGGGTISSGGNAGSGLGGGGAGFKTQGADGGSVTVDGGAGNGGSASTNPALLSIFVGGTRNSGAGGGAAMLIACRGSVIVDGIIDAGGGGGIGGIKLLQATRPGGGGGAGGYVVLQGLAVKVTGSLYANGGGGGAGYTGTANGNPGLDGTRSATTPAPGGTPQALEGAGGAGGVGAVLPTVGRAPGTAGTAGGGGGSVGFLQAYTPDGINAMLTPMEVSPAFEATLTITTR